MDKMKIIISLVALAIIIVIGFFIFRNVRQIPFLSNQPSVAINNHTFVVTVAKTQAEKEKGLSNTPSLAANHGMYFPFDHADFYSFWMKDMKFPIDIIYIANGKVVTVFSNVQPAVDPYTTIVKPKQPANAVLEINAGDAKKYSIKEGDAIKTSL